MALCMKEASVIMQGYPGRPSVARRIYLWQLSLVWGLFIAATLGPRGPTDSGGH